MLLVVVVVVIVVVVVLVVVVVVIVVVVVEVVVAVEVEVGLVLFLEFRKEVSFVLFFLELETCDCDDCGESFNSCRFLSSPFLTLYRFANSTKDFFNLLKRDGEREVGEYVGLDLFKNSITEALNLLFFSKIDFFVFLGVNDFQDFDLLLEVISLGFSSFETYFSDLHSE